MIVSVLASATFASNGCECEFSWVGCEDQGREEAHAALHQLYKKGLLMDVLQVETLVMQLGEKYEAIYVAGLQVQAPLVELFDGSDVLTSMVEPGVEMSFSANDKVFHTLNFTLRKAFPDDDVYQGALPSPLKNQMVQSEMHEALGKPLTSSGPIKMPEPVGLTGGWESFALDQGRFPGVKLVLQYEASLDVFGVVFKLISKGL